MEFHWTAEILNNAPYRVVVADPPWPHNTRRRGSEKYAFPIGVSSNIPARVGNGYEIMPAKDILSMPVANLAADRAVLFLWSQWNMLGLATEVVRAWGFRLRSGFPWIKMGKAGRLHSVMGYWWLKSSEPVLFGTRGKVAREWQGHAGKHGIIIAPRQKHSQKPEEFVQWVERWYPQEPRLELFARRQRPGWTAWGNQL